MSMLAAFSVPDIARSVVLFRARLLRGEIAQDANSIRAGQSCREGCAAAQGGGGQRAGFIDGADSSSG